MEAFLRNNGNAEIRITWEWLNKGELLVAKDTVRFTPVGPVFTAADAALLLRSFLAQETVAFHGLVPEDNRTHYEVWHGALVAASAEAGLGLTPDLPHVPVQVSKVARLPAEMQGSF